MFLSAAKRKRKYPNDISVLAVPGGMLIIEEC